MLTLTKGGGPRIRSGAGNRVPARSWTSLLNLSGYLDPIMSVFTPTDLRSTTSASALISGSKEALAVQFILTIRDAQGLRGPFIQNWLS